MKIFHFLLFLLMLACSEAIYGQNGVSGHLRDNDGNAVTFATVEIVSCKDSSFMIKAVSGTDGAYRFNDLPGGSYIVKASIIGLETASKKIMLFKNSDLNVDLVLGEKVIQLDEVVVQATGVDVRGDTTTYFTNHYKTGQEKTLGEVLQELPGLKIDPNTNAISANGKPVRKILIEKQDLFQGNTWIPMSNLSSEGINSVDVIDNYSEYSILDGFRTSNETVINLNMNDKMKGRITGQADVQGGVKDKYLVKNSSLLIGKKVMLSGILSANNTGKSVLKVSDIINMNGGISELLSNENPTEQMQKMMSTYSSFIDSRKNVYKRNNGVLSLNSVFVPSEKVKILWNGIFGFDRYRLKSDDRYDYLISDLKYDDFTKEKQFKRHLLTNLKISFMPTKDFNIFYTGRFYAAHKNQDISSKIFNNQLLTDDKDNAFTSDNNLLAIKKFGNNSLNFSFDFNYVKLCGNYSFNSDSTFYDGMFGLTENYLYANDHIRRKYSAQLFYLYRLSDRYFFRFGAQTSYDRENFSSGIQPDDNKTEFDNQNYVGYFDNNFHIRFSKDRGKFTFTAGLSLQAVRVQNNLDRDFLDRSKLLLVPDLRFNYKFNNTHFVTLSYDELFRTHSIDDLIDGYNILSYNQIMHSSVNRLFGYVHKVSLTHMLMIPISGFTMLNMASFEYNKDDIADDYSMRYIVNDIDKRSCSGAKSLTWMSSLEKKFIFMPLDAKLNFSFTHNYLPFFNEGTLYKSKSNLFNVQAMVSTHYKTGFNGRFTIDYMSSRLENRLGNNKLFSMDYLGLASYNTKKLYLSFDVRYRDYRMNETTTHNIFYDFTVRYDLLKNLTLQITGDDIFHISSRLQTEGELNSYYTNYRTVSYMPGSILCGIIVKY